MGHYTLSVEPDQIQAAGAGLVELSHELTTRASQVTNTPGEITQREWSGTARNTVCAEMTGLGRELTRFAPKFSAAGEKLKTLATTCRTAKDTTLPSLNSRWDGAQTTYNDAVGKNATHYAQQIKDIDPSITGPQRRMYQTELQESRNTANSTAYGEKAATEKKLDTEYNTMISDLQKAFKDASDTLTSNTMVAVPDSVVSTFVKAGGTGSTIGWCNADGTNFPPELHADTVLAPDLAMMDDRHAVQDGERVATYLDTWNKADRPPPSIPPEILALMAERQKDPMFGQTVANQLGPDEVARIMQKANALLGLPGTGASYQYAEDPAAERARLVALQDQIATVLGTSIATGSTAPGGLKDPDYAKKIVNADPRMAGILFKYADKAGVAFSGSFMHQAGTELVKYEERDPLFWRMRYDSWTIGYGSDPNLAKDNDPTLNFLHAADNSIDSAQGVMGDPQLMHHFLIDQLDHNGRSDAAGSVLKVATVDAARLPVPPGTDPHDSQAWKAAEIASNAIDVAGQGGEPLDGVRKPLADILATYMPDVDRAMRGGGSEPGVLDYTQNPESWPAGVLPTDGWPQFGIRMDREDLRDVLQDIAPDEDARRTVAATATAFNQTRIDRGADDMAGWDGDGQSPLSSRVQSSAHLQGFLTDAMSQGLIDDGKATEEQRKKIAELFLLPTEYIPIDKVGSAGAPIVGALLDQIKEGVTDAYVGHPVEDATTKANSAWETTREMLRLQALDSARTHGLLEPSDLAAWPKDSHGNYIPAAKLTGQARFDFLADVGDDQGYSAEVNGIATDSYDSYQEGFR